jgi:hypothetical protein
MTSSSVSEVEPVVLLNRMEVVGLEPLPIRAEQPAAPKII